MDRRICRSPIEGLAVTGALPRFLAQPGEDYACTPLLASERGNGRRSRVARLAHDNRQAVLFDRCHLDWCRVGQNRDFFTPDSESRRIHGSIADAHLWSSSETLRDSSSCISSISCISSCISRRRSAASSISAGTARSVFALSAGSMD